MFYTQKSTENDLKIRSQKYQLIPNKYQSHKLIKINYLIKHKINQNTKNLHRKYHIKITLE